MVLSQITIVVLLFQTLVIAISSYLVRLLAAAPLSHLATHVAVAADPAVGVLFGRAFLDDALCGLQSVVGPALFGILIVNLRAWLPAALKPS